MNGMVHIAGHEIRVGTQLRQRCGWCGTTLIDYDLARIAVPVGQDATPSTWPCGALVETDGGASWVLSENDGEAQDLPANACAQLDHAVTK